MGAWMKKYWSFILVMVFLVVSMVLPQLSDSDLTVDLGEFDFSFGGSDDDVIGRPGDDKFFTDAGGVSQEVDSEDDFVDIYTETIKPLMDNAVYGYNNSTVYGSLTLDVVIDTTSEIQASIGNGQYTTLSPGTQEVLLAISGNRMFIRIVTDIGMNGMDMDYTEELYVENGTMYYRVIEFNSNYDQLFGSYNNTTMGRQLRAVMVGDLQGDWVKLEGSALETMGTAGINSCRSFFTYLQNSGMSSSSEFTGGSSPKLEMTLSYAQTCTYRYSNIDNTTVKPVTDPIDLSNY